MGIKSFSLGAMVVKTHVCHYCDLKIYPGKGVKVITREGKINIYIHKKARSQALRKTRAQKIKWTIAWRRMNKKIKTTDVSKKKRRKVKTVIREITGMTIEDINREKNETNADRDARKAAAIRQIKDRKAAQAKSKPNVAKQHAKPKNTKGKG